MGKVFSTGFLTANINGIKVNSSLPSHSGNFDRLSCRTISYVVMHYTGNTKDTAKANSNYFHTSGNRYASAHFFVDETSIYQSVKLKDRAWHCGTGSNSGYFHPSCRNSNSIGIEMCTSGSYKVSQKTQKNAAYLCAYLCKKIGISASEVDKYVLRHYDVTHKRCPAQMSGSGNEEWTEFKAKVKKILRNGSLNSSTPKKEPTKPTAPKKEKKVTATKSADKFDKDVSGTYKTTANLNLRDGAGVSNKSLVVIPEDTKVQCYGYYSVVDETKWYYIQCTIKGVVYTGFSSKKYLKRV